MNVSRIAASKGAYFSEKETAMFLGSSVSADTIMIIELIIEITFNV